MEKYDAFMSYFVFPSHHFMCGIFTAQHLLMNILYLPHMSREKQFRFFSRFNDRNGGKINSRFQNGSIINDENRKKSILQVEN